MQSAAILVKPETPKHLVAQTLERFGRIDILINNAGTIRRAPAADYSDEDWAAVIEVNLSSVFRLSKLAGKQMIERGDGGKIVNIASLLSFQGGITVPAYAASKGGVAQLTKALANEWAKHRINVNAIAPGYMRPPTPQPCRPTKHATGKSSNEFRRDAGANLKISRAPLFFFHRARAITSTVTFCRRWRLDGPMMRERVSIRRSIRVHPWPNYRWVICALLFFAATINYIDRQVIGILKPTLQTEIGWTEVGYSWVVFSFQAAYAIGLLGVGRLIDRIGTRKGFSIAIIFWSVAAMGHALARTVFGFGVARFFLGLGEAGNFPAAIKTVAEWFPKKERALATGIFNSGTNIGALVTPLVVPIITIR